MFRTLLLTFFCCALAIISLAEGRTTGLRIKRQSESQDPKRIICYYVFWAARRPGDFKFVPSDIDPNLCTHILYGYARLEENEGIIPYDFQVDIQDRGWASMVELKRINPGVKIILSMGGLFEGSARFTKMAADDTQRKIFVTSAVRAMKEVGFDGLDMSWLYPGFSQGSSEADKKNYVTLIKDLKEAFGTNYSLSMTVPALKQYIESGFDVPELLKYVEFMNVLAYSYHDSTDATVNHHGPLYALPNDPGNEEANVDFTIREYLKRGARPDQLNLVIPLYGVAFVLEDPLQNDIGANTEDEGIGLEEPGALIYLELCQRIKNESWTVKKVNSSALGPYAYKGRLWVAYDDEDMVKNKARYALQKGIGGLGFWSVDQDDFRARCSGVDFPLLRAGREVFLESSSLNEPQDNDSGRTTASIPETSPATLSTGTALTLSGNTRSTTRGSRKTSWTTIPPATTALVQSVTPTRGNSKKSSPQPWTNENDDLLFGTDTLKNNNGLSLYKSGRDIVFSNFQIWIDNHYNLPRPNNV